MATASIQSVTTAVAGETNTPVEAVSNKSKRRKTSHLKIVPETRELRESIRQKCYDIAGKLNKDVPLSKDQMETVARRLLQEMGHPEGYLGWTMVIMAGAFFKDQIASIPPSRRLFLLPHCLKHAEGCPADYDEFGMNCKKCGACSIADFRTKAEEMGYKVLVAEGSPIVLKIIVSGYVDAIMGVACLNVLEKAIDKILLAGIPCMAVPLLSSDCRNTSVDEDWVSEMVALQSELAVQQTRSYVHLMRASSDMFQSPNLERLTGRQRSDRLIDSSSENPLASVDPIAATESLALDFLSKGGKYSRPFITLATYDAMQGGDCTLSDGATKAAALHDGILRAAMSIEMFHKASLVHDDIEDNDAYRYGQPTMHRRYGLPTAINVGDYMIGLGYRLVSRESKSLGPQVVADILECLSGAHTRLAEGQGAELLWRDGANKRLSPLDALKIYALKTSPAFEAALFTGIRLAGDAAPYVEPIRLFARNIGVAFQILNDLGDWEGDQHNKLSAAGDVLGGRPTILLALALQTLDAESQNRLLEVIASDCPLPDATRISIAGELMRKAKVFDQAHRLVDKHQLKAEEIAQAIQPDALKRLMLYLIETVLERHAPESTSVVSIAGLSTMPIASRTQS